jgi:hypothetical protein
VCVCVCARFQGNPKEAHLTVVKRILGYLKHTPSINIRYPKKRLLFNLLAIPVQIMWVEKLIGKAHPEGATCLVDHKFHGHLKTV